MKEAVILAKKLVQEAKTINGVRLPSKKTPTKANELLKSIEEFLAYFNPSNASLQKSQSIRCFCTS